MSKSIFQAAHEDDVEVLRGLVSQADAVDPETGWTALHYAAEQNSARVASLLLEAGADPVALTPHGETPLHLASGPEVARLLFAGGAVRDADGLNAAERALRAGSKALFQVLAEALPESPEYQILRYARRAGLWVRGESLEFGVVQVGWTMRDERCLAWTSDGWVCLDVGGLRGLELGGGFELPAECGPAPDCVVVLDD